MSLFSKTLQNLLEKAPQRTQAEWARGFGIDRQHLNKILRAQVPLGHKTVARISMAFPHDEAKALIMAFLFDEATAIQDVAATLRQSKPETLIGAPEALSSPASKVSRSFGKPKNDPLATLPPRVRAEIARIASRAKTNPAILRKLEMLLKIVED